MKKTLTMVLALVLVAAISVGATLAYLTSTDSVTNTFTVGNVQIKLDEAKANADGSLVAGADRVKANSYKLLPGHTYDKDPIVHVSAGSEDCYLFVQVTNGITDIEDQNATVASQMAENGWALIDQTNGIYVYGTSSAPTKVAANANVTVFESFKVADDVDNTTLASYANTTIVVNAYAIQADGFESNTAAEIWAASGFAA